MNRERLDELREAIKIGLIIADSYIREGHQNEFGGKMNDIDKLWDGIIGELTGTGERDE